jgi:hypothetical protein
MDNKPSSIGFNYLYFGIFLTLLLLISASGIFMKESVSGPKIFFFLYALGQALLELIFLICCASIIQRFLGKISFASFIGATFLLLIFHLLDFLMERILDLSIWETLGFVLDETLHNFFYLLDASGISLWLWALLFALLATLPFLGILLYYGSSKIAQRKPLFLKKEWVFQSFICLPLALLFWEYSTSHLIQPNSYTALIKALPWKFTFLQPSSILLPLSSPLKSPPNEEKMLEWIEQETTEIKKRPNIYLFVIESFREDFITPEIAPRLSQFKEEAHHFPLALSNSNGSHPSWFSIFHSQFPLYWKQLQKAQWKMGSPPIHLLKKWGYQVRVYSSAQLSYYGMEELLFGQERRLVDSFQTFHHAAPLSAADSDAAALQKLQQDLAENPELQEGQLIIVFWDSTHFDYSWPKTPTPKFSPVAKDFAYFQLFHSNANIEQIKNRYRNSVFYIDSLFEKFMGSLPKKEEAIVVITGDHGEEFFEHGNLFHGSHLVHEQTHIPLYIKCGGGQTKTSAELVSQIDIFPTLFHYLSGSEVSFFEGTSIFSEKERPYALLARFNAGRTPYEFCLHNGKHKCIAQFVDKKNIFQSQQLKIRSLCNHRDRSFCPSNDEMDAWIQKEFGPALDTLFTSSR